MFFSNRRKSRIVKKADPLLSVGSTDYSNATVDQLRAESGLLYAIAGTREYQDKESVAKAENLLDRYCRERRVKVNQSDREIIIEGIVQTLATCKNPPPWVRSWQTEGLASDKGVLSYIDWMVNVRLKKYQP